MNEWLNHPAVQSGIAPFIAALIAAGLLNRLRLSGLAVIAGFCITVYLVAGFTFEPLSAVKKIILCGLIAAAIAPLLNLAPSNWRWVRYLIAAVGGATALWVLWPVLQQQGIWKAAAYSAGITTYAIWLAVFMDRLADMPTRAGSAGIGLGIAVGASALLGTSALLGQLGFAIGASCGAYLLIQMLSGKPLSCGRTFTVPLSLLCGLLAPAAMMLAKLPWYCLPVLAAIPVIALMPLPQGWSLRQQIIVLSLFTLASAALCIFLVWRKIGDLAL